MNQAQNKIVQYLEQAHAMELGMARTLEGQAATAPKGSYRTAVEARLLQTREHAVRIQARLSELGGPGGPLRLGLGLIERGLAQALALGRVPLELLRGSSPEEQVLRSARHSCVSAAREIAAYTALERLARSLGDRQTRALAASILGEEQDMLDRLLSEIPGLTEGVVRAEVRGEPAYALAAGIPIDAPAADRGARERAVA